MIHTAALHAPHVGASVVMPGHIGTSIAINSGQILGRSGPLEWSDDEVKAVREEMMKSPGPMAEEVMNLSDDQIREFMHQRQVDFRDKAPTSASQAATIILNDVKAGRWRILVVFMFTIPYERMLRSRMVFEICIRRNWSLNWPRFTSPGE